ncbi:MAG: gliding motility-associated C-terminal domain-containing protein [Catalinimonas sp.]
MRQTLRHLLLPLFFCCTAAQATHIVGGEVTYDYLGFNAINNTYQYDVAFDVYVDRGSPGSPSNYPNGFEPFIQVGVYDAGTNLLLLSLILNSDTTNVDPELPPTCQIAAIEDVNVTLNRYQQILSLPVGSGKGYVLTYARCCRNDDLLNFPNLSGNTFYTTIPSPFQFPNDSPQFVESALPSLCANDTSTFVNSAFDPDGDRLIFSFVRPYDGSYSDLTDPAPAPQPVLDEPGLLNFLDDFTLSAPFGEGSFAQIDPSTGLTRYFAPNPGRYVVTIEITEFRDLGFEEVIIGRTRRELQFIVTECPPNDAPNYSGGSGGGGGGGGQFLREVNAGGTLTFNIDAVDADSSGQLILSASSPILDGSLGYNGPLATFVGDTGVGSVQGVFSWTTDCDQGGAFPLNVSTRDEGCPPKRAEQTYLINVLPFGAPDITGPAAVCKGDTITYRTAVAFGTGRWSVSDGEFVGGASPTGDEVRVVWPTDVDTATVSLVVTSGTGCVDTSFYGVRLSDPDVLTTSADNLTICPGDTVRLEAAGSTDGYRWRGAGLLDSTGAVVRAVPTGTTTYFVDNTRTLTCVVRTAITIEVVPKVARAGADFSICAGDEVEVGVDSVAGYSYTWRTVDPDARVQFDDDTKARPVLTALDPAGDAPVDVTILVEATFDGPAGCASTDTAVVRVLPRPVARAGDDQSVCENSVVQLGDPAADPDLIYAWVGNVALSAADVPAPTVDLTLSGRAAETETFVLTVTDPNTGCFRLDTTNVTITPRPLVETGTNASVCVASSVVLGPTLAADSVTYRWSPATYLDDPTAANPRFLADPAAVGTITYTLTVTDATTLCADSAEVTVTVDPLPAPNAGPDLIVCDGATVTLGTGTAADTLAYAWRQTGDPAVISEAPRPEVSFTLDNPTPTTLVYELTLQNTRTGCEEVDTVEVLVNPLPRANAGTDRTICDGDVVTLGTAAEPGNRYRWTVREDPGTVLTTATPEVTVNLGNAAPTVRRYFLEVTNAEGCPQFDTVDVLVNPTPPAFALAEPAPVCSDSLGTYVVANPAPDVTYTWSIPAGSGSLVGGNVGPAVTVRWNGEGTFPVAVTATNAFGCEASQVLSEEVEILPSPDLTLLVQGGDTLFCQSGTTVATYSLPGALPGSTFEWRVVNTFLQPVRTLGTGQTVTLTPDLAPGVYAVQVRETSAGGCEGQFIGYPLAVVPVPATTFEAGDTVVCPTSLLGQSYTVGGLLGSTYAWTVAGGTIVEGQSTETVVVDWATGTTKQLTVVETSGPGSCVGSPLVIDVVEDDAFAAIDHVTTVFDENLPDAERFVDVFWTVANPNAFAREVQVLQRADGEAAFVPVGTAPAGNGTLRLGPLDTDAQAYEFQIGTTNACEVPLTSAVHQTVYLQGTADQAASTSNLNWTAYEGWDVAGYEVYRRTDQEETFTLHAEATLLSASLNDGTDAFGQCYRVAARREDGTLSWSNEVCLAFENLLVPSNVFSPNGDNVNESFRIANAELYTDSELVIYNRWGREVFRRENYRNDWRGENTGGEPLPVGTYFYSFTTARGDQQFKGWVQIMR